MVFDALAPTYDVDFSDHEIAQALRKRVHQYLGTYFQVGHTIFEIGCGTGLDALKLSQQGIHIIGCDASIEMVQQTQKRLTDYPKNQIFHGDGLRPDTLPADVQAMQFDGCFANFGVINCIDDWQALATWLGQHISKNGIVAFTVMSPWCLWEIAWHGIHGDFRTALRRFKQNVPFGDLTINYPSVKRLTQVFEDNFERVAVHPLGLILPTSDSYSVVEKHPNITRHLLQWDERLGNIQKISMFADHYCIIFRRK